LRRRLLVNFTNDGTAIYSESTLAKPFGFQKSASEADYVPSESALIKGTLATY